MQDWGHLLKKDSARPSQEDSVAQNKALRKEVAQLKRQLAKTDAGDTKEALANAMPVDDKAELKRLEETLKTLNAYKLPVGEIETKISQVKEKINAKEDSLKGVLGRLSAAENLAKQQGSKLDKLVAQVHETKQQLEKTAQDILSLRARKASLVEQEREKCPAEQSQGASIALMGKVLPTIPDVFNSDPELHRKMDKIIDVFITNMQRLCDSATRASMASDTASPNGAPRPRTPSDGWAEPPCKAHRSEDAHDIKGVLAEYANLEAWYNQQLIIEDPATYRAGMDEDSDLDGQNGLDLACDIDSDDNDDDMGITDPELRAKMREGHRKLAAARATFRDGK